MLGCRRDDDGRGGRARGMEGPARAAHRALAHRGRGRAGRRHGDHLPHRASRCALIPSASIASSPHDRHVGQRRRARDRPVARRPASRSGGSCQLTLPYLVFLGARGDRAGRPVVGARDRHADATSGAAARKPPGGSAHGEAPRSRRRPATLAAFAANGLFAGLSGLFLATTLHHPSHALAGATLFLVFTSGVVVPTGDGQAASLPRASRSARSPCSRVSSCSSSPCAFRPRTSRCSWSGVR